MLRSSHPVIASCSFRTIAVRVWSRPLSKWSTVPQGPPAILGITEAFKRDHHPEKMNLGVGAYRDDAGKPYVLPSVRKAEKLVLEAGLDKEYAGITGIPSFTQAAVRLAYSKSGISAKGLVAATQSISGTGALRTGASFLKAFYPGNKRVYLPDPSWANHKAIFSHAGLEVDSYRYFNYDNLRLDFEGMVEDINRMPKGSIILLHACAHNPTGVDPDTRQWEILSKTLLANDHLPFFDMAYQGFASGDTNTDAYAIRRFVEDGHKPILAQSFAKNMGLYGERVGAFSAVCESEAERRNVESQIKILIRPMYSNPPIHGARVAAKILDSADLYDQWLVEVKQMADRIKNMRSLLQENLKSLGSKRDWSHLTSQIGMFAYTGLKAPQMERLGTEYSVYATKDGRISIAGINSKNVERLAHSIHEITR